MSRLPPIARLLVVAAMGLWGCARSEAGTKNRQAGGALPPPGIATLRDNPGSADPALDVLLAANWSEVGIEPAPPIDDAAFMRRATLDITGRIPTADGMLAFVADPHPQKRRRLVDALLASDAYAEHWAEVYTELLLGGAARVRPFVRTQTLAWLEDQFASNTGYDRMVDELLSAQGEFSGNGPQGFVLTHGQMRSVETITAEVSRIFLGVRLECAQCHDHPFDPRYKQEDFYAFAAYFAGTRARVKKGGGAKRAVVLVEKPQAQLRMPTPTDPTGERSGPWISPRFLGRALPYIGESGRATLASGVVGSDLFAKAIVARTWERLLGAPIGEGWDALGGEHDPSHPPLLAFLADRFVAGGHDHADLLRTIVLSTAYRRASWAPDRDAAQATAARAVFAQATVRPLDADQLFRSILIATGAGSTAGRTFRDQVQRKKAKALREYRLAFGDDEMTEADAFSGTVPQALLLLNGELTQRGATSAKGSTLARALAKHRDAPSRVDALYLSTYGRYPTPIQRARAVAFVSEGANATEAYEDLVHALLLSSEFLTIH